MLPPFMFVGGPILPPLFSSCLFKAREDGRALRLSAGKKCRTAGSGPRAENQRMGPNLIQKGDPARGFLWRVCLKNNMEGKSFCALPLFLLSVLPIKPSIPHFPSASDKEGGEERERERERERNHWLGRDYIQAPKDCTRRAAQRWVSPSPPSRPIRRSAPQQNGGEIGGGGREEEKKQFFRPAIGGGGFPASLFFVFGEWIDGLAGRWMTEDIKTPSSSSPPMLPPTQ